MNYYQTKFHRFASLSTIISFLLIIYSLLSVANTPATGYEISIYSDTPKIFWVAIIFGLLNGLFLIASDLYGKNRKKWIVGLFQIVFCNISVISLHALRGYVFYFGRGDASSYVGLAKDVSNYGYFGNNFYPITSIYLSQINQFTNISIIKISNYLPSLFFVFYVLSIYCWSKSLFPDRKFILSSLISSMPIFFAWFSTSIYYESLSIFTLPFFFYLLQRNSDYRFRLLTIIFLIMYPFFHPITGIMVFIYLMVFFILEKFNIGKKMKNVSITLISLSFASLAAWFIQQYSLLRSITSIFNQLIGLLKTPTTMDSVIYALNRSGVLISIIRFFFIIVDEIFYFILSFLAIYLIILRKETSIYKKFYKIFICFIISNLFLLIILFFTRTHNLYRLINLNPSFMLTPPLVGFLIYKFLLNNKNVKTFLVLSFIFISSVTAIFSLYPSPITGYPNNQVTISDIKGMSWLITQKNPVINTADVSSPVYRFADLIYGCEYRMQRSALHSYLVFPPHFGFTNDEIFPINEDRYLVITDFDMKLNIVLIGKNLEPEFVSEDFAKIDFCTNVDKIYENGEFKNYLVHNDG